jgi:N-methylhydantoinase B
MTNVRVLTDMRDEQVRRQKSLIDGYMPPEELRVHESVQFNSDYEQDVDPFLYEILRGKLWNLNWDHQETIRRTSGSLVVVQGYDFNSSIQTELGDGVVFGPGNLFFAGCADVIVQWTLEHRAGNVGIREGDVFIQDDPWIGTNHAMDTAVYSPVFVDGKLFAWVYNVAHERELGGMEPGGFVQSAKDVYAESTFWPPVKICENGLVREDLLDAWVRRSRIPGLMTVEVKAQLAGVEMARKRLLELVERYGAPVVKGVMQRMISDTAKTVGDRLRSVPDGTWRDERYVGGAHPDDKNLYRFCLEFKKSGDRLSVTNQGTDAAVGSFNITAGTLRACILSPLLLFLAHDQYLCGAGVLRQMNFEFDIGASNSAQHPSAVSTSLGLGISLVQAQYVAAKMLSTSQETKGHVFGASGLHTMLYNHMFGRDREGREFAHFPFDGTVGAIGAFSHRDGIDHGGGSFSPINPVGSVELYEQEIPLLYLYRRELPHSGGHGQWRGGATFVTGWVGHKTEELYVSSGGLFASVTQGVGLLGGHPSSGGTMWHATDTAIVESLKNRLLPGDPEELRSLCPDGRPPKPKKFDNVLGETDVFEVMPQPGAGYGDPILREARLVLEDVRRGRLSVEDARSIYGILTDETGKASDEQQISASRKHLVDARLADSRKPRAPMEGMGKPNGRRGLDTVAVATDDAGADMFCCAFCSRLLGPVGEGYRSGCSEMETALADFGPLFMDPRQETGEDLVFRQYICPACGIALDGEVCRRDDDVWCDVRLAHTEPLLRMWN